jgi:Rps23 Pro-64 3,4-dihydroxylase Tpa1-like proline 4-hydroxylase
VFTQKQLKEFSTRSVKKINKAVAGANYFEDPYKHLIVDDFFDDELVSACLKNFPDTSDCSWEFSNDNDIEIKYRSNWQSEFDIPDGIVDAVRILNSSEFLHCIAEVFDIRKLMPDPYFTGGGLNITRKGGLLDVHVDGNYHDASGLNRRMNALVYLNPNWEASWGGEFGLYDSTGEVCLKKVEPIFNRLLVFDSHDKSWHGLPDPIEFPDDSPRRSIILYYYTKEPRPHSHVVVEEPHSALWKKRGSLDKKGKTSREFS